MPNYAKLFREAVEDSKRDYARDNPETIEVGFWMGKLKKGGPDIPCAIWQCSYEPGNPENLLETKPIFMASIGDEPRDPLDVIAMIERRPITEEEHAYQVENMTWVQQWGDDDEPLKRPHRRVDVTKIKPVGPKG